MTIREQGRILEPYVAIYISGLLFISAGHSLNSLSLKLLDVVNELSKWKASNIQSPLLTIFHVLYTCNSINWITYLLTLFSAFSTKCLLKCISAFINSDNLSSLAHSWCVSDNKSHGELLNVVPWDDIPWHPQPHW